MIQGLEQIALLYTSEGKYDAVRNLSVEQKALFELYDMNQDDIEHIAIEFNARNRTDAKNPNRMIPMNKTPVIQNNTHKRGRVSTASSEKDTTESTIDFQIEKSKVGRPKGKKDSTPRKARSDKGKKRGPHKNK